MQSFVSYLSTDNKTGTVNVSGQSSSSNINRSYDEELKKTPTNPKKRSGNNALLSQQNNSLSLEPLMLDKSKSQKDDSCFKLSKSLQVLIKIKPFFAEEEEEEMRKENLSQKSNTNKTIMKQQLKDLFNDLDSILEVPNDRVVCYKGVSVTQQMHLQQQSNSRDYIMSNPIASPNNNRYNRDRIWEYDQVYRKNDDDIEKLYETWIKPHLKNEEVENLNVFTYGSTGCGKTFTIQNILNFLMSDIFSYEDINIECSYMEIYNDKVRDLLTEESPDITTDLFIREDFQGSQCIDGLSTHHAKTKEDLKRIVEYGHDQRFTEETNLNRRSSRSHSILTINVKAVFLNKKFTIVDLAGSERAAKAQNKGLRLKEGAMINKSLLALANCINSLTSEENTKHIPFRDSKLTRLLKHVLTADETTRTVMIACVSGILRNKDETLNTLMYAKRCMGIRNEFQHLNFSSNSTNSDLVSAPTISTLTRARSSSVRNNESRVLSRTKASCAINDNKVSKTRSVSTNVFNSRKVSQQANRNGARRFSVDERSDNFHKNCQTEIHSWKEKFLTITNELNAFIYSNSTMSATEKGGLWFLKKEVIDPKVMVFLERRSWQLVKHSLSNLLAVYSDDSSSSMKRFVLCKITECNEKLYHIQKLVGNSSSFLRELEAITLSKGMVLGQLDILCKVIESDIHNEFNMIEDTYLINHFDTIFNFFDNLIFITKSEDNLKKYLDYKFKQVEKLLNYMRNKELDKFNADMFTVEQEENISVLKKSCSTSSKGGVLDDASEGLPSNSSAISMPGIKNEDFDKELIDMSVLSNDFDEENVAQEININPHLGADASAERVKLKKRRLNINNTTNSGLLGAPQRMVSTIFTPSLGYTKNEQKDLGKESSNKSININDNNESSSSDASTDNKSRKSSKKKGITSLLNGEVYIE